MVAAFWVLFGISLVLLAVGLFLAFTRRGMAHTRKIRGERKKGRSGRDSPQSWRLAWKEDRPFTRTQAEEFLYSTFGITRRWNVLANGDEEVLMMVRGTFERWLPAKDGFPQWTLCQWLYERKGKLISSEEYDRAMARALDAGNKEKGTF